MFDIFLRHFRRKMFVKDFTFDGKGSFFKNLIQDFGLDFGQGAIRAGEEEKRGKNANSYIIPFRYGSELKRVSVFSLPREKNVD